MYGGRGGNYRGGVWYTPSNDAPRDGGYCSTGPQYHGGVPNHRSNNTRRGSRSDSETLICRHNAVHDRCRFGSKCLYKHTLKRVLLLHEICRSGVICLAFCRLSDSRVEIFVTGQGTNVKRLALVGDNHGSVSLLEQQSFTINLQEALHKAVQSRGRRLPDQVIFSLKCINDCLFAGLRTGHISVFHIPTGTSTLIHGHSEPVTSIILVDTAVLSACEAGKICIWSFDSVMNSFSCVNSLETKTTITCLLEVADGLNRHLWAGGNAITVIDLATFAIVRTMPIPNGDFAKIMMRYGQHIIVALNSGECVVLSPNGELVYQSGGYGPELIAMDGIQTERGDLLLLGNKMGALNVVHLPAFQLEGVLQCNFDVPRNVKWSGISVISSLGGGLFVIGGYDGNAHLFRYIDHPENTY
ncbi:hypothetical protein X943_001129 [Babesia divergens]|uniref:C3H1-type domain-containing protein n=1 Tax=Babesia divergens TaxID=32595 RepID=A0AAD9LGS0_BABDI|nr:hypothetical protein X943_001129 [Babesia divergens]